ncbi:uncharacterized protein LOC134181335 isoform X3 [Corticium candelabrum]|uniref:uncharacterized protein LOC134181335 isoform X3 n=1 Tax=Corticium candelabrum TaxID=121492 RepID=UPI002E26B044|nr:uncharacterized protein LOC134181335 isoform X3 [Corticium candelabrum]
MERRDHFDVLIVCPQSSDLMAACDVFEHNTNSKFKSIKADHIDLPYNLHLCRKWNGSPLDVAMVAQFESGGIEATKFVADLAKHFSAGLIAMTGSCTTKEDENSRVKYGTVVVSRRTITTELGEPEKSDETHQLYPCKLDDRILLAMEELVQMEKPVWLDYVPFGSDCPSPRYVKELLLKCVLDKEGMRKRDLLAAVESKLCGINVRIIDEVLEKMLKEAEPWIYAKGSIFEYMSTNEGKSYAKNQSLFLCRDKDAAASVVFGSIGSLHNEIEDVDRQMKTLTQLTGDDDIKAIDREAHFFMKEAMDSFRFGSTDNVQYGLCVVVKGISNYGTESSKLNYYNMHRVTSAAFLRHFVIQNVSMIKSQSFECQLFDLSADVATDWRDVAKRFGMSRHDVETIENKVHLESDQVERHRAYRMLCKWRISEGDKASLDIVKVELEHVKEQQRTAAFGSITFPNDLMTEAKQFCGRKAELQMLKTTFWREHAGFIPIEEFCFVVIKGMGGVGKSSLAAKFALLWKHLYSDGVLYFNAESEETLIGSIKQNLTVLHPAADERLDSKDEINEMLLSHVEKHFKMLLVYDGADNLSFLHKFLPRPPTRVHVLVTTRCGDCSVLQDVNRVIHLGGLKDEDAAAALATWRDQPLNSEEVVAATKLSISPPIQNLPIALAHAGRFAQKAHLSYKEYYELLKTEKVKLEAYALDLNKLLHYFRASHLRQELLEINVNQPADINDIEIEWLDLSEDDTDVVQNIRQCMSLSKEQQVYLTWQTDIDLVEREHPEALSLLEYASFLSSRDIPEKLIHSLVCSESANDAYSLCVSALSSHCLTEQHETAEGCNINIHPLVQSAVRERIKQRPDEIERKLTDLCNSLLSILPESSSNMLDVQASEQYHSLLPHLSSLAKNVLMFGVRALTCLLVVKRSCTILISYQQIEKACYLSAQLYDVLGHMHFESDIVKHTWLIQAMALLGTACAMKQNRQRVVGLLLDAKKMVNELQPGDKNETFKLYFNVLLKLFECCQEQNNNEKAKSYLEEVMMLEKHSTDKDSVRIARIECMMGRSCISWDEMGTAMEELAYKLKAQHTQTPSVTHTTSGITPQLSTMSHDSHVDISSRTLASASTISTSSECKEYFFKVLVIGDACVGKTSYIESYVYGKPFKSNYKTTVGVDFAIKDLHLSDREKVRLQLWDLSGQERYTNMSRVYYRDAVGCLLFFDLTRVQSFRNALRWKYDLDNKVHLPNGQRIPCLLVANKNSQ